MLRSISAVAACAALLAACGSAGNNNATQAASKQAAGLKFASCMRANGVPNFPDPGSNGGGGLQIQASDRAGSGKSLSVNGVPVSAPGFQRAQQACRKDLPNGGHPSAAQQAQFKHQALAMSRCMRSHGVPNFPDPTFGTGPGGGGTVRIGGPGIDPQSPAFQAAQRACGGKFGIKGPPPAAAG
jgi:hypothetical protein